MKLYATVASERATKGQGGNKYLYIDLLVGSSGNRINAGRVSLLQNEDKFFIEYHETLESDGIPLKTILKGKSGPYINLTPKLARGILKIDRELENMDCVFNDLGECQIMHGHIKGKSQKGECEVCINYGYCKLHNTKPN